MNRRDFLTTLSAAVAAFATFRPNLDEQIAHAAQLKLLKHAPRYDEQFALCFDEQRVEDDQGLPIACALHNYRVAHVFYTERHCESFRRVGDQFTLDQCASELHESLVSHLRALNVRSLLLTRVHELPLVRPMRVERELALCF